MWTQWIWQSPGSEFLRFLDHDFTMVLAFAETISQLGDQYVFRLIAGTHLSSYSAPAQKIGFAAADRWIG